MGIGRLPPISLVRLIGKTANQLFPTSKCTEGTGCMYLLIFLIIFIKSLISHYWHNNSLDLIKIIISFPFLERIIVDMVLSSIVYITYIFMIDMKESLNKKNQTYNQDVGALILSIAVGFIGFMGILCGGYLDTTTSFDISIFDKKINEAINPDHWKVFYIASGLIISSVLTFSFLKLISNKKWIFIFAKCLVIEAFIVIFVLVTPLIPFVLSILTGVLLGIGVYLVGFKEDGKNSFFFILMTVGFQVEIVFY